MVKPERAFSSVSARAWGLCLLLLLLPFSRAQADDAPAADTPAPSSQPTLNGGSPAKTDRPQPSTSIDTGEESDSDSQPSAEDQGKELSGNVSLASDYIFRGVSQTGFGPALQGGFDWAHPSGFYLGIWGSNVKLDNGSANLELSTYGGYEFAVGQGVKLSLGFTQYLYYGDATRDSWEIPLTAEWHGFQASAAYAPQWAERNGHGWYYNMGWMNTVVEKVKFGAFVGFTQASGPGAPPNYVDYRLVVSREFLGVEWALNEYGTNYAYVGGINARPRAVATVTKSM